MSTVVIEEAVAVDLVVAPSSDQSQSTVNVSLENLQDAAYSQLASCTQAPTPETPATRRGSAECEGLHDLLAASDVTAEEDLGSISNRIDNPLHHGGDTGHTAHLSPAMDSTR
jgi:hypothetical protein